MRKSTWIRALSLCLCLVLLAGTVSASGYTLDLSGDSKVDVWDIQLAVNQGKGTDHEAAILQDILGNPDELHANADGAYEIYTALGLYNMANMADTTGVTFKLMADIDLGGRDWAPVEKFRGTFDGQGHTVSNMRITGCGENSFMGFFATVDMDADKNQALVKDLNLRNVNVTAAANAEYIGLFAGQIRGIVQDCTVTGFVTDQRTNLSKAAYIGPFAGRLNDSNPDGMLKYTAAFDNFLEVNSGSVGEKNPNDKVDGITAKMGMDFADLADGSKARTIGLAGVGTAAERLVDETGKVTWNWQDITNSSELVSQTLRDRRASAAQYMYDMGTVYWTPSQDLRLLWYRSGDSDRSKNDYSAKSLYRGIPYNHGSSSLERFNYWVNNPELPADGFYLTDNEVIRQFNEALTNKSYYEVGGKKILTKITSEKGTTWTNPMYNYLPSDWDPTLAVTGTYTTGFTRYIGNDCSSAAAWAWRHISAVAGSDDCVRPNNTNNFFPSPKFMTDRSASSFTGVVPVGGIVFEDPADYSSTTYGNMVNADYDADPDKYLNALTLASMGDCLMGYKDAGGHTLMLMGDAVTIRNKSGKLLPDVSYVITSEQGGGGSNGTRASDGAAWTSSWSVNKKTTFANVVRYGKTSSISEYRYFPVTCTALQVEDTPAATAWCKLENGTVSSNFQIVSTTVDSQVVYTKTTVSGSRTSCSSVKLADVHTATTGTVTVLLANGQTYSFDF